MKVQFYVDKTGHVLDNRLHPVDKPALIVPEVEPRRNLTPVGDEPSEWVKIKQRVYFGVTISLP